MVSWQKFTLNNCVPYACDKIILYMRIIIGAWLCLFLISYRIECWMLETYVMRNSTYSICVCVQRNSTEHLLTKHQSLCHCFTFVRLFPSINFNPRLRIEDLLRTDGKYSITSVSTLQKSFHSILKYHSQT